MEHQPFSFVARTGPMPAGARFDRSCRKFVLAGATIEPACSRSRSGTYPAFPKRALGARARLVVATFQPMNMENLNRLLSAANEFDASDLHLVAGVPPAFRVNGEIIIADEDALTEDEITAMSDSLLNEQQKKKFGEEWELCISILHSVAGGLRAPVFRGHGHPGKSFRFLEEQGREGV